MSYIYEFDIAAFLLTAALVLLIVMRREYPSRRKCLFLALVVCNGIVCAADIIAAQCINTGRLDLAPLATVACVIYAAGHPLTATLYLLYAFETVNESERDSVLPAMIRVVYIVVLVLCVTSPFTHLVFWMDGVSYSRGSIYLVLYLYAFACLLAGSIYLLKSVQDIDKYQVPSILVSLVIIICVVVVQAVCPMLLIEGFGISVLAVQVYYFAEVGSAYMYRGTYCYNHLAFHDKVERLIRDNGEFCVIGARFLDNAVATAAVDIEITERATRILASRLQRELSQKSVFCLRGGFFAVVTDPSCVQDVIKEMSGVLNATLEIDGVGFTVRPSFCFLEYPGVAYTANQVDDVLVYALNTGKGDKVDSVVEVDDVLLERQQRENRVEHILRDSLAKGTLMLHYQPIINTATGKYESAEVLVRLWDKKTGTIYPGEFIPYAEENGLVGALGEQVLRQACSFYKEHELDKLGVKYLEVNLSAVQLSQEDLPRRIMDIIGETGVLPSNINLEITETALIKDAQNAQRCMAALRESGITFSLDDYGVGTSSARNIYKMPLDLVKLDMSIVNDAMKDPGAHTLLGHMVAMLRDFDKEILAEGVENEETVDMLMDLGVDYIQGFLYSRPLAELSYLDFIKARN